LNNNSPKILFNRDILEENSRHSRGYRGSSPLKKISKRIPVIAGVTGALEGIREIDNLRREEVPLKK